VFPKDVSIFEKVAFFIERKTWQLFSSACLTDMQVLCGVRFLFVHQHFASTAQQFILCSIQVSWRCITVAIRTFKFVVTLSNISWGILLISVWIVFLSASIFWSLFE